MINWYDSSKRCLKVKLQVTSFWRQIGMSILKRGAVILSDLKLKNDSMHWYVQTIKQVIISYKEY